jgi:hypothetical protein
VSIRPGHTCKLMALLACLATFQLNAQGATRYPVVPRQLPESEEVELARSAAPNEVSSRADVYVLRAGQFVKAREGTNGCSCMVARDLHEGSLYPICFDKEGTRTLLRREMMETSLRAQGLSEEKVKSAIREAIAQGTLTPPSRPAVAYMMSPRQVLFSSQEASGRRVGAWYPHLMISGVNLSKKDIGFEESSRYLYIQAGGEPGSVHDLVLVMPVWSDNTPALIEARRP